MSESTLSICYHDLQISVGRFLGYGVKPDEWNDEITSEVDEYIQAGIRQFYYPPKIDGNDICHCWSFLNPMTTLNLEAGRDVYALPDTLSRIVGDLYYDSDIHVPSVILVSEYYILSLSRQQSETGTPRCASVRFCSSDGETGQRMEIQLWPTPNKAYQLTYHYEAYAGRLTVDNPFPLGGMKYSELVVESCLSIAEQRANDERGIHWDSFTLMLKSAIAQDQCNGARYYGAMGSGEAVNVADTRRMRASSYDITYKGITW